jgi:hypothetical protein
MPSLSDSRLDQLRAKAQIKRSSFCSFFICRNKRLAPIHADAQFTRQYFCPFPSDLSTLLKMTPFIFLINTPHANPSLKMRQIIANPHQTVGEAALSLPLSQCPSLNNKHPAPNLPSLFIKKTAPQKEAAYFACKLILYETPTCLLFPKP